MSCSLWNEKLTVRDVATTVWVYVCVCVCV